MRCRSARASAEGHTMRSLSCKTAVTSRYSRSTVALFWPPGAQRVLDGAPHGVSCLPRRSLTVAITARLLPPEPPAASCHSGIFHIGFKSTGCGIRGQMLEPVLGSRRFGGPLLHVAAVRVVRRWMLNPNVRRRRVGARCSAAHMGGSRAGRAAPAAAFNPFQTHHRELIILNLGSSWLTATSRSAGTSAAHRRRLVGVAFKWRRRAGARLGYGVPGVAEVAVLAAILGRLSGLRARAREPRPAQRGQPVGVRKCGHELEAVDQPRAGREEVGGRRSIGDDPLGADGAEIRRGAGSRLPSERGAA